MVNNTNTTSNATDAVTFELPEYVAQTSLVFCSVILAVGFFGNLLVIIVILTSKALRSSTNFFLLNLSIADLLVSKQSLGTLHKQRRVAKGLVFTLIRDCKHFLSRYW